jgi:hypothetical protein
MKLSLAFLITAAVSVMALESAPLRPVPRELFSPATEQEKRDLNLRDDAVCCCLCDPCEGACRTCLC